MDKIEVHQIMPYLPYKLKAIILDYKSDYVGNEIDEIAGIEQWDKSGTKWSLFTIGGSKPSIDRIKPIIRPFTLNDIYDYFSDKLEADISPYTFISEEFLHEFSIDFDEIFESKTEWLPVGLYNLLIKHHFDIFGWIEKGLAVDINGLNQK